MGFGINNNTLPKSSFEIMDGFDLIFNLDFPPSACGPNQQNMIMLWCGYHLGMNMIPSIFFTSPHMAAYLISPPQICPSFDSKFLEYVSSNKLNIIFSKYSPSYISWVQVEKEKNKNQTNKIK